MPSKIFRARKAVLPLMVLGIMTLQLCSQNAAAQTWTSLKNQPSFAAGTALLLTDGRVLVQDTSASDYWTLTPDNTGSYVNGTWAKVASMPSNYGPLYYASAVLPDGRVIVEGGEYNFGRSVETTLGAIYDPVANSWTAVAPPSGWAKIGDAAAVVLANGTFMLTSCCDSPPQQATLDPTSLTWTVVGTGKADSFNEEGLSLLPDGAVLAVDINNTANPLHAEQYVPGAQKWVSAGNTGVQLVNTSAHEIGPGVLRPNGTVFWVGGNGNTATYTPSKTGAGTWVAGPVFPKVGGSQLDVADGPGAVLPDGNVLIQASPGVYNPPSYFFEYDGTNLNQVATTTTASEDPSFAGRMLVLPTGQIFWTDGSGNAEVYTAAGTYNPSWAPVILGGPTTLVPGHNYRIGGTLFNGMTQGAYYGDDAQMATNYPLVRIVNTATGHVFYARTFGHSAMAVAFPGTVTTNFAVPAGIETGPSDLYVVANGIPSAPFAVTVN